MTTHNCEQTRQSAALQRGQGNAIPRTSLCTVFLATALSLFVVATSSISTAVAETRMSATHETTIEAPAIEVTSPLDMRDDEYNSDYIFGMTKGVANSTIIAAVKPLFFLVTIPLDIAFLPFAAIGGFF